MICLIIILQYDKKLTKEGYLIIKSDCTRSQQLNLADCMRKLRNMIRDAEVTKREPSPETQERIRQRYIDCLIKPLSQKFIKLR